MSLTIAPGWLSAPGPRAVMEALGAAGHDAWYVGGCVRNALLDCPDSDIDIATTATPGQTTAAAEAAGLRAVPTGAEHGTITVVADHAGYEVTTLRRDVETDGRHARVVFSTRIEDDAARRDFTMNALYATVGGEVVDPLGGLPDLLAGRVRFIGDAKERITEDYLRILRFFRFSAWYGDPGEGLDADGLAASAALAEGLDRIAAERIGQEVKKLLAAPDPAPAVAAMAQSGILARILPGADARALAPLIHLEGATGTEPDAMRRLAVLGGEDVTDRFRLSRAEARRLVALRQAVEDPTPLSALAQENGAGPARDVALLRAALLELPLPGDLDGTLRRAASAKFPVTAKDLMPDYTGPKLGARLADLKAAWIASDFSLDREALLALPDSQ